MAPFPLLINYVLTRLCLENQLLHFHPNMSYIRPASL